jgi:hypothetical protein
MSIATGFALLLTSGIPVYGMPKSYVEPDLNSKRASAFARH